MVSHRRRRQPAGRRRLGRACAGWVCASGRGSAVRQLIASNTDVGFDFQELRLGGAGAGQLDGKAELAFLSVGSHGRRVAQALLNGAERREAVGGDGGVGILAEVAEGSGDAHQLGLQRLARADVN